MPRPRRRKTALCAKDNLKDAAVEVAAQLEGSAVHKQMLQSLELAKSLKLAGTVGLTTRQLIDGKGMKHVVAHAMKTHGLKGLSPASVFAQLSGIKIEKFEQGAKKYFDCAPNDEAPNDEAPNDDRENPA